jgi:ABC-type ATPase with predicted acetyltransferase domain
MTGPVTALRAEGVVKRVGGKTVLRDLTIDFHIGEITLVRGDRGSGKTTLARMFSGQTWPDAGSLIRVGPVAPLIGSMWGFSPDVPIRHALARRAAGYGVSVAHYEEAIRALLDRRSGLDGLFRQITGLDRTIMLFASTWLLPAAIYVTDGPPTPSDERARARIAPLLEDARRRAAVIWIADTAASPSRIKAERVATIARGGVILEQT